MIIQRNLFLELDFFIKLLLIQVEMLFFLILAINLRRRLLKFVKVLIHLFKFN